MIIIPFGTLVTISDGAAVQAVNAGVDAMNDYMAMPVVVAAACYYTLQGYKLANGDASPVQNFVPQLIRVMVIIWLASDTTAFNFWVRGLFDGGITNDITAALAKSMGSTTFAANPGASPFGAAVDSLWARIDEQCGIVEEHAGRFGFLALVSVAITYITVGLALLAMVGVHIITNWLMGIMIILAKPVIGLALFDCTRQITERAVGKGVALIVMQIAAVVILEMAMTGDSWFMSQIKNAASNYPSGAGGLVLADEIANLFAMVLWFLSGAFAVLSVSAIAYSLGSGVAISAGTAFTTFMAARGMARLAGQGVAAIGRAASRVPLSRPPNIEGFGFARPQVGHSTLALPAPPPPIIQ